MTPRKELFVKIQNAIKSIPTIELVDLYRKQFERGKENYPMCFTAALIQIGGINYTTMTENKQEGTCTVDVILYCKDGWLDQHQNTTDPQNGLIEIDLIDAIVEKLQFLHGTQFTLLEQVSEDENDISEDDLMSWRLTFSTTIYKQVNYPYQPKKIQLL